MKFSVDFFAFHFFTEYSSVLNHLSTFKMKMGLDWVVCLYKFVLN